jgi:tetratricopeptide (TPR) repeat protein
LNSDELLEAEKSLAAFDAVALDHSDRVDALIISSRTAKFVSEKKRKNRWIGLLVFLVIALAVFVVIAVRQRSEAEALRVDAERNKDALVSIMEADSHVAVYEVEKAQRDYQRAVEIAPGWAFVHERLGDFSMNTIAKFAEAERAYRTAITLDGNSEQGHSGLCMALSYRSQPAEAVAECTHAIDLYKTRYSSDEPDQTLLAAVYNARGYVYLQQGDLDRALVDFDEAEKKLPNNYAVAFNRGLARGLKGDARGARAEWTKGIDAIDAGYPEMPPAIQINRALYAVALGMGNAADVGPPVERLIAQGTGLQALYDALTDAKLLQRAAPSRPQLNEVIRLLEEKTGTLERGR